MIGWLLVEWLMADWRRIPFTCSYIPGKGFVPHMVVKGFASYVVFTLATGLALRLSLFRPQAALVLALILGAAAGALSVRRARDGTGNESQLRGRAAGGRDAAAAECGLTWIVVCASPASLPGRFRIVALRSAP